MFSNLFSASVLALRASPLICPSLPTCPDDNECTFNSDEADLKLSCSTDFYGGDMGRVYAATVVECMKICASTDECVALSYVGEDCYLKNALNTGSVNIGVTSANIISRVTLPPSSSSSAGPQRPCPASISCPDNNGCLAIDSVSGRSLTLTCGVDFYGGDLEIEWTNGLAACSAVCAGNPQCVAASFVGNGHNNGPCYLKSKNLGPLPDSRVNGFSVSLPISSSPSPEPANPVEEDISKSLNSPEGVQFCVSYINYEPPVETLRTAATISTVTRTTITDLQTHTPPTVTLIETVVESGETTIVASTETVVTTTTVQGSLKKRLQTVPAAALQTPSALQGWSSQDISAACSKVATFTSTTTLTTATEIIYTATETSSTTKDIVAPAPTITVATTSPLVRTISVTSTTLTTVTSRIPNPVEQTQCASRPLRLCCLNIAPWSTNSGVWGGICGYTPSDPAELVGARCITRPASGKCPSGTSEACCRGSVPGQCALGTQCARA